MTRYISRAPDEVRAALNEITAGHALILRRISSDGIPELIADNIRAIVARLQQHVTSVRESMTAVVESGHQARVLCDVAEERARQREKHGDQRHLPDGTAPMRWSIAFGSNVSIAREERDILQRNCRVAAAAQRVTFRDILLEEVAEAFAEDDPEKLRAELVQVAAVAVQWVEAIDARQAVNRG